MNIHPKVKWSAIAGVLSIGGLYGASVAVTVPPGIAAVITAVLAVVAGYLKSSGSNPPAPPA